MFNKLDELQQLYAQNLLSKCKGCHSIEECRQDMRGLIPTTQHDELSNRYVLAFKKCEYARGETNTKIIFDITEWEHDQKDEIISAIKDKKSLYLYGDVGTGKTTFLKWLANYLNKKGNNIHLDTTFNIARNIKASFNRQFEQGEQTIIDKLQQVEYLFLDDVGSERKTEYNIMEIMWPIIDYRYAHKKSTFISSNYSIEQLYELYGKAIGHIAIRPLVSRLKTYGVINLKGRNFRL